MKKLLILALSLGFLGAFGTPAMAATEAEEAPPAVINIDLKTPEDIDDAKAVSNQLTFLAFKVMECIKTGAGTPQVCQCNYPEDLGTLKTAYDQALKEHPDWAGTVVNYNQEKDIATAVSFPGIEEQFKRCPEGTAPQGYEEYEDVEVPEGEMGD